MKFKWTLPLLLAFVLLALSVGCKKDAPDAPPAPAPSPVAPEPEPEEIKEPPAPPVVDKTPDPLDGEIMQADASARGDGLLGDVYFEFDKYDLMDEARGRLSKNAEFLKEYSKFIVTIQGHCDERGTNDYNIALGDRRANAAREYLVSLGISDSRIKTLSYGEERPVCTQSDEGCWSRNRRGEFHLTGRQ